MKQCNIVWLTNMRALKVLTLPDDRTEHMIRHLPSQITMYNIYIVLCFYCFFPDQLTLLHWCEYQWIKDIYFVLLLYEILLHTGSAACVQYVQL